MTLHNADNRLLLELYADGELNGDDLAAAESLVASSEQAQEYLRALEEMRELVAAPIHAAVEATDFSLLRPRVESALGLGDALARSVEMDALAMALADGVALDDAEVARAEAYAAAHPEVAESMAALAELRDVVRAPIEAATEQVDFDAFSLRMERALDAVDAERAAAPAAVSTPAPAVGAQSWFSRFMDAIGGKTVFASAATAAAVVLIMLPMTRDGGNDGVQIHNHYYELSPAEAVGYEFETIEKGFEGNFLPGDESDDMAPVIWIAPEGAGVAWEKDPESDPDAGRLDLDSSL